MALRNRRIVREVDRLPDSAEVVVIGGGLAGSEAAWQSAERGLRTGLHEMRPVKMTPAHSTGDLAELVCSNSFRSDLPTSAVGLLKSELELLGSLIIRTARESQVPAGKALAVDRKAFASQVTRILTEHPRVELVRGEVVHLPSVRPLLVCTGPLTSDALSQQGLTRIAGEEHLYFYDATSPIVTAESVDMDGPFWSSRYGAGEDYLNLPLTREEYLCLVGEIRRAETIEPREFEKPVYFEGCMPVEEMVRRGEDTLRFGPMKPVGLEDPKTGRRPWAVVQLRKENREGTLLGMVGFQTSMTWSEQKRVFSLIPGLRSAEFVRYGVIHRNTYINAPRVLDASLQVKEEPGIFVGGQLCGIDGYVEAAATGLVAGINAHRWAEGLELLVFPRETLLGAMTRYVAGAVPGSFQPINVNFGLLPPLERRIKRKRDRNEMLAARSLEALRSFLDRHGLETVS